MEQRRTLRFKMRLPVSIVRCGAEMLPSAAVTTDISSGGVLLLSEIAPEVGSPIEFVVTLNRDGPVHMRCLGNVLRVHRTWEGEQSAYRVAASIGRHEFPSKDLPSQGPSIPVA